MRSSNRADAGGRREGVAVADLTFDEAEVAFRDELRVWLAEHVRELGPEPTGETENYDMRIAFQRQLAEGGWAAVQWPREFGGRGATLTQSAIFYEELARSEAPMPANMLGILLAGPTIMTWGTPAQKERFLSPILTGEEIWCQGFSEPDAGSDFASLKTRAVRDGDDWVVTGQKVWTSEALGFALQVGLRRRLDRLIALAAERRLLEDPTVAERLGELHLQVETLRLIGYRGLAVIEQNGQPGPEGSLGKWLWSDTNQQLTQYAADLLGPSALREGDRWAYELLRARGNSIEGGTTEILKNIVAERVLGLPKSR